jgi:hypothetical protein
MAAFLSGLLYSTGRVPNHRSELRRFTERCVLDIDKSIAKRALRRHRWHELDLPAARRKMLMIEDVRQATLSSVNTPISRAASMNEAEFRQLVSQATELLRARIARAREKFGIGDDDAAFFLGNKP